MIKTRDLITQDIQGSPISEFFGNNISTYRKTLKDSMPMKDEDTLLSNLSNVNLKDGIDGLFAKNGFELIDLTANLPLYNFFWAGQVPVRYGGGFAEQVSAFRLNYQLPDARLTGTQTNERYLSGVKEEKITVPVYAFQHAVGITEYERMKSRHINYDLLSYRIEALRLAYQRELEWFAFMGNEGVSDIKPGDKTFVGGLYNQQEEDGTAIFQDLEKSLKDMDAAEIVDYFIEALNKAIRNLRHNEELYPDTLALPPYAYEKLLQPAVVGQVSGSDGTGIATIHLDILAKALSRRIRRPFNIVENPYLDTEENAKQTTAGIVAGGENGRAVLYKNDDRAMRFNIPLPLTGGSIYQTHGGFYQNYIGLVSPLIVVYPTIIYINDIAPKGE